MWSCCIKAMYKAKAAKQTCLMICAKFALARLEILCSTSERDPQMMESLREEVLKENNPVLNSTFTAVRRICECLPGTRW